MNKEEQETYHTILTEFSHLYTENKHLKDKVSYLEERVAYLERSNNRREETILYEREENFDLSCKIDKAIEYINDNVAVYTFNDKDLPHWEFNDDEIKILLKILRGNE